MSWLKQLLSRRGQYDALSEEIQAHLDEKVEELVAEGHVAEGCGVMRRGGNLGIWD